MAEKVKGKRAVGMPEYKKGWNLQTCERSALVTFLDQLTSDPRVPMVHIHIINGDPDRNRTDLVDVVFFRCKEFPGA